jgi:hypothetical protein
VPEHQNEKQELALSLIGLGSKKVETAAPCVSVASLGVVRGRVLTASTIQTHRLTAMNSSHELLSTRLAAMGAVPVKVS